MNLGEPITGAVPDAVKPPESTPSSPESGPKGIKVEVYQPDIIHKLAVELGKGPRNLADLHNSGIKDALIETTSTSLWSWGALRGNEYSFLSWYHFTKSVGQRPDYGYYGPERIATLQKMLEAKGFVARHEEKPSRFGVPIHDIIFSREGRQYELYLGFSSRQNEEEYIRRDIEESRQRNPTRPGYAEKYELPRVERGLIQGLISLKAVPRKLALGDETAQSAVYDKEQEFTAYIQKYAKVYEDVTGIVYDEAGVESPKDRTITFRPPILNQDALTQVASTETESPIHLVEAQVVQELPSFDEIAGQDAAVAEAKRLVLAINRPEVFEKRGVKRPKGILFYGPPGTGKTLIAKAMAAEANATFLEISAADIGTKWYGESERLMQKVFDLANDAVKKGSKIVLFFDELDSLAPSRENAHEATRKVVATLLQNMDGMKSNPNVTIIAATNRPQDIDPALKRPGRIDKLVQVGLPNVEGRQAILKVHMEKAKKAATASGELFSEGIDFAQIGQATEGMSGADLANLVNLTLEEKTMAELEGSAWALVTTEEMLATAHKLGMIKEEKRKMGFFIPEKTQQNNSQVMP